MVKRSMGIRRYSPGSSYDFHGYEIGLSEKNLTYAKPVQVRVVSWEEISGKNIYTFSKTSLDTREEDRVRIQLEY